jgi:hypothetical protein
MEEKTMGNHTIWWNPIFDRREMLHALSKRHGVSHYLTRAQHTITIFLIKNIILMVNYNTTPMQTNN